jgi:transposase
MYISVGIDIAKEVHWVTVLDTQGVILIDRKLHNTPTALSELIEQLHAMQGTVRVGLDVVGGIAGLAQAFFAEAHMELVHVPGLAVNRARQGTVGGENKSDPRDARTIAEQVRSRSDLRAIDALSERDLEIRLLVGRRRDLIRAQTQRIARMHDLLVGIFPGLERELDLSAKGPLHLLTRFVTPPEIRSAGTKRLLRHMQAASGVPRLQELIERVLRVAQEQLITVPAQDAVARLIKELAVEAMAARDRLNRLEDELTGLLDHHPDAALIRSLPGMGAVMTAEFIAEAGNIARFRSPDALAAAAGIAPVLKQSGKIRFLKRPLGGNKALKRVFYQSAFSSLHHPASRTFYDRKRREGKRHHQAVIALARRRVNVLYAMLAHRQPFQPRLKNA